MNIRKQSNEQNGEMSDERIGESRNADESSIVTVREARDKTDMIEKITKFGSGRNRGKSENGGNRLKNGEEKRKRKAGDEKEEREKMKLMNSTQKGVARKHGGKMAKGKVKMNDSSEKWKKRRVKDAQRHRQYTVLCVLSEVQPATV